MVEVLGPLTVTVLNIDGDTRDRYGNPTITITKTYELDGCNLQQKTTDELIDPDATTVTEWLLFTPDPEAEVIRARDQIRIEPASLAHVAADAGQPYATFDIDGEPDFLDNHDGTTHHLELLLRRSQL
jgi:hypothetical protein